MYKRQEWNTPVRLSGERGEAGTDGTNGIDGRDGISYRQIFLYQNAVTAGTRPTNTQGFSFSNGNPVFVSVGGVGWNIAPSTPVAPQVTFRIVLTIRQTSILSGWSAVDSLWSTPAQVSGPNGSNGRSVYQFNVYQRSTSVPAAPTGGSYNFTTSTATPPTNWFTSVCLLYTSPSPRD